MLRKTVILITTFFLLVNTSPLFAETAATEIMTEEVTYSDGDTNLKGFLATPKEAKSLPAVIVVHEWWGHNDYVRSRAKMLAEMGYAAFALDMYGDGKTAEHPTDAGKFSSEVGSTKGLREKRFRAAMKFLETRGEVDNKKIAAIGYCFGGNTVIEMARMNLPLAGVVSFHGALGLAGEFEAKEKTPPILVLHGAADSFISEEDINNFKSKAEKAGVVHKFIAYPEAKHGFSNPAADESAKKFELDIAYNKAADEASWSEMKNFLQEKLLAEGGEKEFKCH